MEHRRLVSNSMTLHRREILMCGAASWLGSWATSPRPPSPAASYSARTCWAATGGAAVARHGLAQEIGELSGYSRLTSGFRTEIEALADILREG